MPRLLALVLSAALALAVPAAAQEAAQKQAERAYERGVRALDERQWEKAMQAFEEVPRAASRADGALYWKAYAAAKLARRAEALAALAELPKAFPASRWLNDAKALELEVRQASGQPVAPENAADEELKLLAINSLLSTDPERAAPLLEKVLQGSHPPKLKERALFVLSQSGSPRAREIVVNIARGKSNPDLQMKALQHLGLFGGQQSRQTLAEIYSSSTDLEVKRAILRSFMLAGERPRLLAAAKQEKNAELRKEAIRQLGLAGAQAEIWELYQAETSAEVKEDIIRALLLSGQGEKLVELARTEKNPALRQAAIRNLGMLGNRWGEPLKAIYAAEQDKSVRSAVIQALFLQHNVTALIELARKETDPVLKKDLVQKLSLMHSKEAADFMMEILNK